MIKLVFAGPDFEDLAQQLHHSELESAAVLLGVPVTVSDGRTQILIREICVAGENDYVERTPASVTLSATFCLPLEKKARFNGWSLIYVHTHPHQSSDGLNFSSIDNAAEEALASYLAQRGAGAPHVAMVLGKNGARARRLGGSDEAAIVEVGPELRLVFNPLEGVPLEERFDRQVRAFGEDGQKRLAQMTVAIVGLGGTGSHIAQQLAYLGVGSFILVDGDTIEKTNLNRVVGASRSDIGAPKAAVARRTIQEAHTTAKVDEINGDITDGTVARSILPADFMFGCTDTHASRHLLNQVAHQYRIPLIDMGVAINVDASAHTAIAGHVIMTAPGLPCLWCANHLNAAEVRRELMTAAQRQADPYFNESVGVRQPAVISLNGTVASAAVTMFLAATVGLSSKPRYITYDANRGRMNGMEVQRDLSCNFCGPDSTSGWGDTYPLPVRSHE